MKKFIVLSVMILSMLGCSIELQRYTAQNSTPPDGLWKTSGNFQYVVTCLENTQFISYQIEHGLWVLVPTGKECNKSEL